MDHRMLNRMDFMVSTGRVTLAHEPAEFETRPRDSFSDSEVLDALRVDPSVGSLQAILDGSESFHQQKLYWVEEPRRILAERQVNVQDFDDALRSYLRQYSGCVVRVGAQKITDGVRAIPGKNLFEVVRPLYVHRILGLPETLPGVPFRDND